MDSLGSATTKFKLGKTTWVAGLWWMAFEKTQKARSEARHQINALISSSDGEQGLNYEKLNCFALHKRAEGVTQAGYGLLPDDLSSQFSLAAALIQVKSGSWLGKFHLPDGFFWAFAAQDGIIYPDGDFISNNEESINAHLNILRESVDFTEEIICEDIDESSQKIQELIEGLKKTKYSKMYSVRPRIPVKRILLGTVILIAVSVLWSGSVSYYQSYKEAARIAKMTESQKEIQESQAREQAARINEITSAWKEYTSAKHLIAYCGAEFSSILPVEKGWDLVEWICTPDQQSEAWVIDYGSFSALPTGAFLDLKNRDYAVRAKKNATIPNVQTEILWTEQDAVTWMTEYARKFKGTLQVSEAKAPKIAFMSTDPGYKKIEWSIAEPAIPITDPYWQVVANIPGLIIQEIRWTKGSWGIKGEAYVQSK